jgi:hypothetical protein
MFLNERNYKRLSTMETTMLVIATDQSGQQFNTNLIHNLLVELMVKENVVLALEEEQT